jgi:hypothetical protein
MNQEEIDEIKKLELNKTWVNAFSVATKAGRESLAKQLGEQILGTLLQTLNDCQSKNKYPYETVILFTVS